MRTALLTALLFASYGAAAQDLRVIQLEQDVRNLERQLQTLTRELNELRGQLRVGGTSLPATKPDRTGAATSRDWLNASNWRRVKPGMSELEVIELLGPPNTMRQENGERVLLYAMEIGAAGFLGGSIRFKDRAVIDVEMPTLR